ncbi:hypothetical protein KSS87_001243 [Heliosperma pusillum]|nr:hypothetical protein KSS87_001243 [Heliosperma pusillum]
MPRPFGVKHGNKRRKREENYDRDEIKEDEEGEEVGSPEEIDVDVDVVTDLPGIPITVSNQSNKPGAIFILERASLEVAKVGKSYQILNSEDHANFLKKHNKNPAEYRPDIVHQALLMILDSPLNKSGRVRAVYVRTEKGVLFEVKPHVRIPRTYKRFAGVMLQLLQKLSISAVGKRDKLFRVIKNPVTQYLPVDSRKIGFSFSSEKLVDIQKYVAADKADANYVFVVGAMAHGKVDKEYVEDYISISGYPMSAAWCIARICEGLQQKWTVL